MFTPKKRCIRKKRGFLPEQKTFVLFNSSNLKTSKVAKVKLSLQNGKLYFVPMFLVPPKVARGCPMIMVVYKTLKDLRENLLELSSEMNCIGVSIEDLWYSAEFLKANKIKDLDKKAFTLLIAQSDRIKGN